MCSIEENKNITKQSNQQLLNSKVQEVINKYKEQGVNKFQINSFNLMELHRKPCDIQLVDFQITEPPKESYVCIIIYAGDKDLTYDNICMMYDITSAEHQFVKATNMEDIYLDKLGLVISDYDIDKAGFVEIKEDEDSKDI